MREKKRCQESQRLLGRREFVKNASMGALTAAVVLRMANPVRALMEPAPGPDELKDAGPGKEKEKKLPGHQRLLGKTGLPVSTIGFGAMITSNSAVIRKGLDLGINYIDTAHCYQRGNNEKVVAEGIKGRRKDVFVATKVHMGSQEAMIKSAEASLKSLQTDYIDVLQIHNLSKDGQVANSDAMAALERLKKDGKIRFAGVSTHRGVATVLRAAARTGFYDVVLAKYNFRSPQDVKDAVAEAAKAGVGVVAMKTQAGGYKTEEMGGLSPHQAALKWVLENENVSTTIPSMVSFEQVEENARVMGKKMGWSDRKTLDVYARATDKLYCRLCDECRGTCPKRVAIPDVMRSLMYADGYGETGLGRSVYAELGVQKSAAMCADCSNCSARCVNGLDIAARMVRAHRVLA